MRLYRTWAATSTCVAPRRFTVAKALVVGLLAPSLLLGPVASSAGADDHYSGAGVAAGEVTMSPGVPPPSYSGPCLENDYTLEATAVGTLSGSGKRFQGLLEISGSGSGCDTTAEGSGTLTVTVTGNSLGTTVHCKNLSGPTERLATSYSLTVEGTCKVGDSAGSVTVPCIIHVYVAEGVPVEFSSDQHVTKVDFAGQFTMTN